MARPGSSEASYQRVQLSRVVTSDARLEGLEGRPTGAELLGFATRVLEFGSCVRVHELAGLDPLEAVAFQELGVRCFQQRSRNSAGPEVDVASPLGADWVLDRDVSDLKPPARREHAKELVEDSVLVRDEVDDPV